MCPAWGLHNQSYFRKHTFRLCDDLRSAREGQAISRLIVIQRSCSHAITVTVRHRHYMLFLKGRSPEVPGLLYGVSSKCWLCTRVSRLLSNIHWHEHTENCTQHDAIPNMHSKPMCADFFNIFASGRLLSSLRSLSPSRRILVTANSPKSKAALKAECRYNVSVLRCRLR